MNLDKLQINCVFFRKLILTAATLVIGLLATGQILADEEAAQAGTVRIFVSGRALPQNQDFAAGSSDCSGAWLSGER